MEGAQATISLSAVIEGVAVLGVGTIGYFIKHELAQLKKNDAKITEIISDWRIMSKDVGSIAETLKEAKPKLESLGFMDKRIDAAFKRIDEQQAIINGLRERSHDLASFITRLQLHVERNEEFKERLELKPIVKKGE